MPFEEVAAAVSPPSQDRPAAAAQDTEVRSAVVAPPTGQLLLGIDKRNPLFAVYEDESGEQLLVFYGFEILEVVPHDRTHPQFKLLLGRLYNAGLKLRALCESFAVDPKTIRRWGAALQCGDPAELVRVLEGRAARRKRTAAVENFARLRWPALVAERRYGAATRLRQEIQRVFDLSISRSGLQELIGELKASEAANAHSPEPPPPSDPPEPEPQLREVTVHCANAEPPEHPLPTLVPPPLVPAPPANTAHLTPFFPKDPTPALYWCDHAGVLLFASTLAALAKVSATPQPILAQWMAALWLGAQNIEQTKFLNAQDLELILGPVVRFPTPQREQLKALAQDPTLLSALWRFNLELLGASVGTDFYFDPHTKHYTGEQNVLKGWCPKIRFADKVLHSDFIHTTRGEPLYFETTDNFADLRERFGGVTQRMRLALGWPNEKVLTFIVDRGVYGLEFFQKVSEDPSVRLMTWQKGFVSAAWDPKQVTGTTTITRYRNSSKDLRGYQFEFVDRVWEANPQFRQIVVQATNDRGRMIQVALLTNDLNRAAAELVRLMFGRWVQENDFKYLDQHFGINQITSYQSIDYAQLKAALTDRPVRSAARQALDQQLQQVNESLKRQLLAEEQALQASQRRAQKRPELEAQMAQASAQTLPALKRQLAALRVAEERYQTSRVERRKRIEQIHQERAGLEKQIAQTPALESRLEAVIRGQTVKLEGQSKRLLDTLRIMARNGFYQALQPFKEAYDNFRDDHEHFRQLTQAPGVLEVGSEQIVIHLMPRAHYGGELRQAVLHSLEVANAQGLEHPCLAGRKLKFRLGHRSEMEVKITLAP